MIDSSQLRPKKQTLQWTGDNQHEVEALLDQHVISASKRGEKLHIIGLGGLEITLNPGDTIILDGDSLGIQRPPSEEQKPFIIWTGNNLEEFAAFLSNYAVRMAVAGEALLIHGGTQPIVLNRGDRLIRRDGQIVVSVRGKDH